MIFIIREDNNSKKSNAVLFILSGLQDAIAAEVCEDVFDNHVNECVGKYVAYGAETVFVTDDPILEDYRMETYQTLAERLILKHQPDIFLIGVTDFCREFAPRVAKRAQILFSFLIQELRKRIKE